MSVLDRPSLVRPASIVFFEVLVLYVVQRQAMSVLVRSSSFYLFVRLLFTCSFVFFLLVRSFVRSFVDSAEPNLIQLLLRL